MCGRAEFKGRRLEEENWNWHGDLITNQSVKWDEKWESGMLMEGIYQDHLRIRSLNNIKSLELDF